MHTLYRKYVIVLVLAWILLPHSGYAEKGEDSLSRIKKAGLIRVITRNNAHCYYTYRGKFMGFEYDLASAFASYLGVDLVVKTFPWKDMIRQLNKGAGDVIAASKTITPSREKLVDFSDEYLSIQQRAIIHEDNHTIKNLKDLNGKIIHVRKATSYEERLAELVKQGLDIAIELHDDVPTEELIRQIADREIEVAIADSNIAQLNRRYYPTIKIGIAIERPQSLGWAVKKGAKNLLNAINSFFATAKANGTFDNIYQNYYGTAQVFDRFDLKKFHQRIKTRLPKYERIIRKAANQYDFDWRLIAAATYQESHFNPRARSYRGVRGLMQLTLQTAQEMGVTNRLDPEQSIMGGVKYLRKLYQKYKGARGFDRILITLASYNVGPRHVADAQRLARKQDLNPNTWSSLEKILPLLCYEKYIKMSKNGYCRGTEAVRYVRRIVTYYDILRRQAI